MMEGLESISGCFQSLKKEELDFIEKNKTQINYLKGETIFKQGAFAPHVLFVNQGLVKLYLQTGNKQISIRLAHKGDFMAFSSVFGDNIYNYSALALKDSMVCMIDKEALKQLLLRNPEFALQITSKNCKNEVRYLQLIENVSYKQMRGKLASALLYLTREEFKDENVFSYLTRQEIADFASVTIESTIKFLKEFEKESIIKLEGRNIELLEPQLLLQISRNG